MAETVKHAGISLGIGHLPPSAALMRAGRAYAVTANSAPAQDAFLCGLVAESLRQGRCVLLVAASTPDAVLQALPAHGLDGAAEQAAGRLCVLRLDVQAAALMARHGAQRLLDEMDHYFDVRDGLIVIAGADAVLDSAHPRTTQAQAQAYARWLLGRRATGVFVFSSRGNLSALDGSFAGLAHLSSDAHRLRWEVDHWRAPEGSLIHRDYGLAAAPGGSGLLADGGQYSARERRVLAAPDRDTVYATSASVSGARGLPPGWHTVTAAAELAEIAAGAIAATFVLDLERGHSLEALAQLIHRMRSSAGNGIKIVVRERGRRLRYNQEMLLLRVGANSVIDASLSFSRFLAAIEALREQIFTREIAPDFDQALRAAMPPAACGYLRPQEFCAAVREAADRGQALGLRSALLRLVILPQLSHLEVLRSLHLTRAGDLFTADDRSVYLFLFACREPDLDAALERVLTRPPAEQFEGQIRWLDDDALRAAIDGFERRLRQVAAADFSGLLQTPMPVAAAQPAPEPMKPSATPAPAIARSAAPTPRSVQRIHLPAGGASA